MTENKGKILFLRKMKEDFTFTANYTQMLADKLVEWNYSVYIYDFSSRKLIDYNNKAVERYFEHFQYFDQTPLRIIVNIIAFMLFSIKNPNNYGICHVMYLRKEYLLLNWFVNRLSPNLYLSVFGSDIKISKYIKKSFKKIYYSADKILVTNNSLKNPILSIFDSKISRKRVESKIQTIMLPLKSLEILENGIDSSKVEMIKKKLGINNNEIVIMCGTTARLDLEQLDLLVDSMVGEFKNKNVLIIFSLTYGGNPQQTEEFIRRTKNKLSHSDIYFLTEYLELDELLALRTFTDIYINVRKHDQFVASMIEALHCKSHVITGSWLPYEVLDDEGFDYNSIDTIAEAGEVASKIVNDIEMGKSQNFERNRDLVNKLWHPTSSLSHWKRLYEESI